MRVYVCMSVVSRERESRPSPKACGGGLAATQAPRQAKRKWGVCARFTGDAVAIDVQLLKRLEAVLVEVHHHPFNHVLERLNRQLGVVSDGVDEREVDQIVRAAVPHVLQPPPPLGELGAQRARLLARLVDDVVGAPAPRVDRPDGLPLVLVKELGAKVEGLRVLLRDLPARLVRLLEQFIARLQNRLVAHLVLRLPRARQYCRRCRRVGRLGHDAARGHAGEHVFERADHALLLLLLLHRLRSERRCGCGGLRLC